MIDSKIDTGMYRDQLVARKRELTERLTQIEGELDEAPPQDVEDRATEREDDEVLERLGNAGLRELRRIEAALKHIDDGSYGICAQCGENILPERLKVVPHTMLCRNCAR